MIKEIYTQLCLHNQMEWNKHNCVYTIVRHNNIMTRKFEVQNYKNKLPSYVKNGEISISTRLIAKHYLDEQAENYNWIEMLLERIRFFNRLQQNNFFKYKPQYKPPFTESKKGFSNIIARALAKAFLDKYENISIFDDFDSYYKNSKKKKYKFTSNIITEKVSKGKGPDLLCKDSNGEFVIVECKGRLKKYTESDLNNFISQSNNGKVKTKNGVNYKTKHFAVPFYISYGNDNSVISIVDPPEKGVSAKEEKNNFLERVHYFRVLLNLGYRELAYRLIDNSNDNHSKETPFLVNVAISKMDNKKYILPVDNLLDIDFFYPYLGHLIYTLDLEVFKKLKYAIQNNSGFEFTLDKSSDNKENIHLSNDGTLLMYRNEIKEINTIKV